MNRRTAIGGILGLAGIGITSVAGYKYVRVTSNKERDQLNSYFDLISELVDVIIPPTNTPGAKSAEVQNYVIAFMEECASMKEYNNFLNGIQDIQDTCIGKYDTVFENISESQRIDLLEDLDSGLGSSGLIMKINNKLFGRSFFNILKTLTIEGYCSSLIGATEHLEYRSIPGMYKAITQLGANQKAWATR